MAGFNLHPRIALDSEPIGKLPLCAVRLHKDARYPWLVLVPMRPELQELHDVAPADRPILVEEIAAVSQAVKKLFVADRVNVAALGNVVPQLHVHCVARFASDDAWPGPVWGAHEPLAYEPEALKSRVDALRDALAAVSGFAAG